MKKTKIKSVRESFVARFGEEQTVALECAAAMHKNGVHDNPGSDPFKWVICICIGAECISRPEFRDYHGITIPLEQIKDWVLSDGNLATHDGDIDYLAASIGYYNEWLPQEDSQEVPK